MFAYALQWPFSVSDGNKTFSVRWDGFYEAKHDGPIFFFVNSAGGVRLFVESNQVIDQWDVESANATGSYCCVNRGQMYRFRVEYRKVSKDIWPASVRVDVATSEGVLEDGLFPFYTNPISMSGGPFSISVMPAAACAGNFALVSPLVVTAGVQTIIQVYSRDAFGNPTIDLSRELIAWEFIPQGRLVDFNVTTESRGSWNVSWTPQSVNTRPSFAFVSRSELKSGVAATFYSDSNM